MNTINDKKGIKSRLITNILLIIIVILLAVIPLVISKNATFGGADDKAKAEISTIDPNYKPWFSLIWEPPSSEISSMLFALQAAIGSGVLFYGIGYLKGRAKREEEDKR